MTGVASSATVPEKEVLNLEQHKEAKGVISNPKEKAMKPHVLVGTALGVLALCCGVRTLEAGPPSSPQVSSTKVVTSEPGLVPAGTPFVIRTNDVIKTDKALRDEVYPASVVQDVRDQHGNILIPKDSKLDLVVLSFGYLGPGGAGNSELGLCALGVVIRGVNYPIHLSEPEKDGGLTANVHPAGKVLTRGPNINVPSGALLRVRTENAIRLSDYQR
jgi:hypothetical protein